MDNKHVILSFLGTSDYLEANYILVDNNQEEYSCVSRYIQEALLANLPKYFHSNRSNWSFRVFLTEDAQKAHFSGREKRKALYETEDYNPFRSGSYLETPDLRDALDKHQYVDDYKFFNIPEGYSPPDLWQLFDTFFNGIPEGATVYFDLTHSFRSIPMLGLVALNYARAMKNIKIGGVYYGPFESLGPTYKVKEEQPDPEEREVIIMNLIELVELQDLTYAASDFLRFAKSEALANFAERYKEEELASYLRNFEGVLVTNRLEEIKGGKVFTELRSQLKRLKGRHNAEANPAFEKVLDKVAEKTAPFKRNKLLENGLKTVRLCLEHNLVQQGLTLLLETLVSHLFESTKDHHKASNTRKESSGLQDFSVREDIRNWLIRKDNALKDPTLKGRLQQNELGLKVRQSGIIIKISHYRNDINHAGYGTEEYRSEADFHGFLKESLEQIESMVWENKAE